LVTEQLAIDGRLYGQVVELLLYTHLEANFCDILWEEKLVRIMKDRLANGSAVEKTWTVMVIVKVLGVMSWQAGSSWVQGFGPWSLVEALDVVSDGGVRLSSLRMLGWVLHRAGMAGKASWTVWAGVIGDFVGEFECRSEEERRIADDLSAVIKEEGRRENPGEV
jgi:hypothetical protein